MKNFFLDVYSKELGTEMRESCEEHIKKFTQSDNPSELDWLNYIYEFRYEWDRVKNEKYSNVEGTIIELKLTPNYLIKIVSEKFYEYDTEIESRVYYGDKGNFVRLYKENPQNPYKPILLMDMNVDFDSEYTQENFINKCCNLLIVKEYLDNLPRKKKNSQLKELSNKLDTIFDVNWNAGIVTRIINVESYIDPILLEKLKEKSKLYVYKKYLISEGLIAPETKKKKYSDDVNKFMNTLSKEMEIQKNNLKKAAKKQEKELERAKKSLDKKRKSSSKKV